MLVKDVIKEYHEKVPFPWTPLKIEKAGYAVKPFLLSIGEELEKCEDIGTPAGKAVLKIVEELRNT